MKRTKLVTLKATEGELASWKAQALSEGLTLSDLIRNRLDLRPRPLPGYLCRAHRLGTAGPIVPDKDCAECTKPIAF